MKNKLLLMLLVFGSVLTVRSQVSISGPACVLPGLGYQYLITTTDTAGSGIHVCLTGGTFTSSGNACLDDSLVSAIYVTWNSGITSAVVSYTSPAGTATQNVSITTALQAGSIDTASQQQTIADSTSPAVITCPAATGGSCAPSYTYQWQQSVDNLSWNNITGATGQNMDVNITVTQNSFFRRAVTETNSGSIAYSGSAAVYINPPAQQ